MHLTHGLPKSYDSLKYWQRCTAVYLHSNETHRKADMPICSYRYNQANRCSQVFPKQVHYYVSNKLIFNSIILYTIYVNQINSNKEGAICTVFRNPNVARRECLASASCWFSRSAGERTATAPGSSRSSGARGRPVGGTEVPHHPYNSGTVAQHP